MLIHKRKRIQLLFHGRTAAELEDEKSVEHPQKWARQGLIFNQTLGAHASSSASLCSAPDLLYPIFEDGFFFPVYPLCLVQ